MVKPQDDPESPVLERDSLLEKHPFDDASDQLTLLEDERLITISSSSVTVHRPRIKLRRILYALLPSFLKPSTPAPAKHGIAALDGLRGLACLFVFNEHYVICYQSRDSQHWINRVPFIRLWWHGKGAVYLFFVISGYVLSYKPLKLIRKKDYSGFIRTISSSILRRGFRLYLPCLVASFIIMILTMLGVYDYPAKLYQHYSKFMFLKEAPPDHKSIGGLLTVYWSNVKFIFCSTFPFDIAMSDWDYEQFDPHQWSIPVEFRGSMALFTLLVGIARMNTYWRLASEICAFWYLYNTGRVHICLFFGGLICGEIDLIRQAYYAECNNINNNNTPSQRMNPAQARLLAPIRPWLHMSDKTYTKAWILTFFWGYFMISSVREAQNAGNWFPKALTGWVGDPDVFLLTYGSILATWAVANCAALGIVFNSPLVQYLGNISYALYLVHGTTIRSLGYLWLPVSLRLATMTGPRTKLDAAWWAKVTNAQATVAHVLGLLVVGSATFWYADVFWVRFDMPIVRLARWVEGKLTEGAG